MKKYLKTIEDIEALRNTDTKIYNEDCETKEIYYQFVNGVLCEFVGDGDFVYNTYLTSTRLYIEVEDEPSEEWIGKLGFFWDVKEDKEHLGKLMGIYTERTLPFEAEYAFYEHFRPLTPEEVEKYTGYKVVNNKMQASELANNKMQAKDV